MHKKDRREYFRAIQKSFPLPQYALWNEGLAKNLKILSKDLKPKSLVAAYRAREREADLSALFSSSFRFCFPRVLSKKGDMEFRLVEPATDEKFFEKGQFGIWEPKKSLPLVEKQDVYVCFVPLLAFDSEGQRLGQGMGFYDRFLAGFQGKRIGVGFEWQFSKDKLPVGEYDQRLDLVVTEHKIHFYS